ncbi:hypothetical protein PF003_g28476 [Phytophthora fragariae]|nr:hypothetical protein PF003_g28476 [Phytophthora fragariae]
MSATGSRPEKNQAAVAPSAERPSTPASGEQRAESSHSPRMDPNGEGKSAGGPPEPKPPRKWVTVPQAHGRKLYAHQATLQQRQVGAPSRFAELFDDSEDDENQEEKRPVPQHQSVVEISSGDETEVNKPAPITAEAKKLLHLITAKPPKQIDSPQLVALKQRERDEIQLALATTADFKGPRLPETRDTGKGITSFAEIEELLGMREVTTPSTGNCMAMALAQAIADHDLAAHGECLESLTTSLKRGIKWTALLNCTEQFNHFARTTTLINVGRGWEGMDARESGKQFRWFLHEYAESSSDRQEMIPRHVWGCSELMATAANFLQRQIYVLAYNTDKTEQWYCSKYRPSTISRGRKLFNTGQQIPLQVGRCLAEIKKAKKRNKVPPLVVRYWGEQSMQLRAKARKQIWTHGARVNGTGILRSSGSG